MSADRMKPGLHGPNSVRLDWTPWQRFVHWRLRAARKDMYGAILYRRKDPERYRRTKAREDRWCRLWIKTFQKAAR